MQLARRRGTIADIVFHERELIERLRTDIDELRLEETALLGKIFYRLSDGDERIEMAPGASASKNDAHVRHCTKTKASPRMERPLAAIVLAA